MKNVKKLMVIFCLQAAFVHANGPTTQLIFSLDENIHKPLIKQINAVDKGGSIYGAYFAFTNNEITKALIAAHKRGVDVRMALDYFGHNKEESKRLFDAGVPVRIFTHKGTLAGSHLHSKSMIMKHPNGKTVVFLGSANASQQAKRNSELVFMVEDDQEYYDDNYTYFTTVWDLSTAYGQLDSIPSIDIDTVFDADKEVIEVTPAKTKMIYSGEYDLIESAFALRIKRTNVDTEQLDIVVYSFSDDSFKQALSDFFKRGGKGRLVIDKSMLEQQEKFLTELAQHGALVYIYEPKGQGMTSLQHIKALVRHGQKPLVVISENNLTESSKTDLGKAVFFPGDYNLAKSMVEKINKLISDYCTLYIPKKESETKRKLFFGRESTSKRVRKPENIMEELIRLKELQQNLERELTNQRNAEVSSQYGS